MLTLTAVLALGELPTLVVALTLASMSLSPAMSRSVEALVVTSTITQVTGICVF
jgi:hypothetical protein